MTSVSGVSGMENSLYASLMKVQEDKTDDNSLVTDDKSVVKQVSKSTAASQSDVASMQDQIDQAISNALQKLDKSASATEVMSAIRNTVDSTLKANGIDPSEMKGKMQPPPGAKPGQPPEGHGPGGLGAKIDELLTENGFNAEAIKAQLAQQGPENDSTTGFVNAFAAQQGVDAMA